MLALGAVMFLLLPAPLHGVPVPGACGALEWQAGTGEPLRPGREYHATLVYWYESATPLPGCLNPPCPDTSNRVQFRVDSRPAYANVSLAPSDPVATQLGNGTWKATTEIHVNITQLSSAHPQADYSVTASGCMFPSATARRALKEAAPAAVARSDTPSQAPDGSPVQFGTGSAHGVPGPGGPATFLGVGAASTMWQRRRRR